MADNDTLEVLVLGRELEENAGAKGVGGWAVEFGQRGLRLGLVQVPTEVLRAQISNLILAMTNALPDAIEAGAGARLTLTEVEIKASISAAGKLQIIGSGVDVGGEGGLTFTFRVG